MGIGSNQRDINYLKGRKRIVSDAGTGQTYVTEYNPDEDAPFVRGPEREVANPIIFDLASRTGWQTMIDYPVSRDLTISVWTESPDVSENDPAVGPSPFNVPPDFDSDGVPYGAATAVGRVEMGHLGISRDVYFNAGAGEMYRFAAGGETLRYEPLLFPKYFPVNDSFSPIYRIYTLPDGTPLTNLEFNNPSPRTGNAVFSFAPQTQGAILGRRARSWAYTSTGTGYNDVRSRPQRKFFGSIGPNTPGQAVRIPVAWNATHVEVTGSPISGTGNPIPLIVYQQYQNTPPDPVVGVRSRTVGGEITPAGVAIPLINNVEWIYVAALTTIAPGAQETLFEVNYWLGT